MPTYRIASSIWIFRALIDRTAGGILSERYGEDHVALLDHIWKDAAKRWATLAPQSTLGARITVRLAAVTASAYEVLVARGVSREVATQTVHDIAWTIYQKMGSFAWIVSGIFSRNAAGRLRTATVAFRAFPFSAPSYEWISIPSPASVVAFDCLRCPVAEYFKKGRAFRIVRAHVVRPRFSTSGNRLGRSA